MAFTRSLPHTCWFAAGVCTLLGVLLLGSALDEPRLAAQTLTDPPLDELEQNRQTLEKYRREEPEHYARLRHDLRQFLKLPPDRQAHLRQIDRDVNEEGGSTAFRLMQALARYVEWLEHLPPAVRQELAQAPRDQRVALIRKMREQEWIQRLPLALREQIKNAGEKERPALVARIRKEEGERRARWRVVIRHWDAAVLGVAGNVPLPMRLDDLSENARRFVTEALLPRLSDEEKKRLSDAEGAWPDYPRTLVELSDKYPVPLPGPFSGPRTFAELPAELQKTLPPLIRKNPPPSIKEAEGKWPDYLIAIADYAEKNKGKKGTRIQLPSRYCPSKPSEFQPQVRNFIDKTLWPRLSKEDQRRLSAAEGQWPLYPRLVLELARKKGLVVPQMGLPGRLWNNYRTSAILTPEVQPALLDPWPQLFARHEPR